MAHQLSSTSYTGQKKTEPGRVKKALFVAAGSIFLALGCVGIVVPVLPTTPFLLLSAACYYKGSQRMHRWLLNNRWFGNYIKNYKEGKGLSLRAKGFTLALLWLVIGFSALVMMNMLIIQVILLAVAVGVSLHIFSLPTFKQA